MKIQNLHALLLVKLQALYDVEGELIKALPKIAKKASDGELRAAFTSHLEETKRQRERLEGVFEMLGEKPKKARSEGIRGIIEDGEWLAGQTMPDEVRDAGLVGSALYVEHYEMAGYEAAISFAEVLTLPDVAASLEETRVEEENAASKLSALAETSINMQAGALSDIEEDSDNM